MRTDIAVNTETSDLILDTKEPNLLWNFEWENLSDNDGAMCGVAYCPDGISLEDVEANGVVVHIPYEPNVKKVKIGVFNGRDWLINNHANPSSHWFPLSGNLYGNIIDDIKLSELIAIDTELHIIFKDGKAIAYSSTQHDLLIRNANIQNQNMMLQCMPGNNLRYPLVGVGLRNWVNSNMNVAELAKVLQDQFTADGTPVIDAQYDFDLQKLYLKLSDPVD